MNAFNSHGIETIAVFDLDGTLTRADTFLAFLADWLVRHPKRLLRCWHLPLDVLRFKLGWADNAWLKTRFLTAVLGGASRAELERHSSQFVERILATGMRPGALAALEEHVRRGNRTVLLSASPDIYVTAFAHRLRFSECVCTKTSKTASGKISGRLNGENCYGVEKLRRLEKLLGGKRPHRFIVAYADHSSDFPLMQWANQGVLVNPSAKTKRLARGRHFSVVSW